MKLPAGILKNTTTERFHPIVFHPAPMPSGADSDNKALRHRSRGHHTEGFDTLEQAQAWITDRPECVDCCVLWFWNGEGIPAMIEWFLLSLIEPRTEPIPT